jgi:uncharacterized membrane protein YphA (DoxX/SURF4 family)
MHEVTLRARWAAWVARAESPAHPSGLVAFRILFGLLATFGALRFEWNGWVERSFQAPTFFFHYWGFSWVQPLSIPQMHALFITMAICGLCIALGLFYRVAAIVYFLAFTYVELCDVTNYLNHYYLQSILALLLCVLPLHRVYSLDAKLRPSIRLEHFPGTENSQHYPRYFTWLLRAQLTLVYFFAAMAKFTPDWLLHGQPMQIWLHARTDAPLVGPLFDMPYVPLAMSWAGFLYDLTIPFWLLHPKTRTPAYGVVLLFHAFTKLLFPIGLFPVIMTVGTLVFFPYDWPVLLQRFALRVRGRFASPDTPFRWEIRRFAPHSTRGISREAALPCRWAPHALVGSSLREVAMWRRHGDRSVYFPCVKPLPRGPDRHFPAHPYQTSSKERVLGGPVCLSDGLGCAVWLPNSASRVRRKGSWETKQAFRRARDGLCCRKILVRRCRRTPGFQRGANAC